MNRFTELLKTKPPANQKRAVSIRAFHQFIQSVVATGGVYKGQGRNQRELMTHAY